MEKGLNNIRKSFITMKINLSDNCELWIQCSQAAWRKARRTRYKLQESSALMAPKLLYDLQQLQGILDLKSKPSTTLHNICFIFKIFSPEKTYVNDRRAAGSVTMIKFDVIHKFSELFEEK
jgi:hypothetical protein